MAEDQLRTIVDGIRTRLQADLETQLGALASTHEQVIADARRAAEAEAEQRWSAKVDATRVELAERMHAEVAAARADVEQRLAAESTRVRGEAEQAAADAASQARRQLEQAVAEERERARADATAAARTEIEQAVAAERARAQAAAESVARTQVEQAVALERGRVLASAESAARAQIEQAVATERARAQASAESAARTQIEQAVAAERARAQVALDAERQRADRELSEARAALDAAIDDATRMVEEARATPSPASAPAPAGGAASAAALLDAVRAIDAAASLSDALAVTVRAANGQAARAVLFIVNGTNLQEYPVPGVASARLGPIAANGPDAGLLGEVLRNNETMMTGRNGGPAAPSFARLPQGRLAVAVPFVLTGRPVAVLYADEGAEGQASPGWQEAIQILGRHAAAHAAYLTAMRTAQAVRTMNGSAMEGGHAGGDADHEEAQGARRYARLLVSEIKLYNEGAVRQGRERRDLLDRLKPEIERARRLYDERVAPSVHAREAYFQQELVQTLADGDQSLLG